MRKLRDRLVPRICTKQGDGLTGETLCTLAKWGASIAVLDWQTLGNEGDGVTRPTDFRLFSRSEMLLDWGVAKPPGTPILTFRLRMRVIMLLDLPMSHGRIKKCGDVRAQRHIRQAARTSFVGRSSPSRSPCYGCGGRKQISFSDRLNREQKSFCAQVLQ